MANTRNSSAASRKTPAGKKQATKKPKKVSNRKQTASTHQSTSAAQDETFEPNEEDEETWEDDDPAVNDQEAQGDTSRKDQGRTEKTFVSFLPGHNLENFADKLGNWTIKSLKKAIAEANIPNHSRCPRAVQDALKIAHRNFEKTLLILCLIGNCRESVLRKYL